jgi:DNA-binding GntR family transcriptional regulator
MAEGISAIRAALQTISEAPPQSLMLHVRELCQANAAIAEALVFISQSSSYHAIRVGAEAGRTAVAEDIGISDFQTQDQEENAVQETHNMLQRNTSWRHRSEHAVVRLAQY